MSACSTTSLVIVLAGGAGERLYPLTKDRAKPAVFFGGPYRIIDFTLSNCINSGLRRIFIATQYKSLSLNRHIRMGWSIVSEELGEFVEILPPQKRVSEHWYQGTADAVYQNLYSIVREEPAHVIVLSGDHVYKMDYAQDAALPPGARRGGDARGDRDARRGGAPVRRGRASTTDDRVTGFSGKAEARRARFPASPISRSARWASTSSIPTCSVTALEADAARPSSHDFGKDIIPALIRRRTDVRLPLLRREQEGVEVLARHRHARRVLRREHGSLRRRPGVQPVRSRSGRCAPISRRRRRRSSCSRRRTALRRGARLDHLAGLHHLGQPRRGQRALPERARAQLRRHRADAC